MDYLKVLGLQLKVELDCDSKDEFLIRTPELNEQMESVKEIISLKNPDVIILPEMCYLDSMSSYYGDLSKDKLVIAGSIYDSGVNKTIVYNGNKRYEIPKCNASGAEPMVRFIDKCSPQDFLKYKLDEHTFMLGDKKLIVLNCMEYYQNAYYIAREAPGLFGIVCICSNNNPKVFLEESRVIHNHVEDIYTFMINSVSNYQGKPYGKGESYIYGPIQGHEKEWLLKEGVMMDDHACSILKLGESSEYFYGEFRQGFSRFGRSDEYLNNPRGVEVGTVRKRELK
ncbi:MAG: hypothetical protein NC483_01030 [Ruminococcus sp.]|nr:hypothetical protein [Ruminococcus sp.]